MHFYFPASRVFVTAIPKTGCTSILNFLHAVDIGLDEADGESTTTRLKYLANYRQIHMTDYAGRYRVGPDSGVPREAAVRFATLRNPVDRTFSCWIDKFVLARGDRIFKAFHTRSWFPWEIGTVESLQGSFDAFLSELETSPRFLRCDPHWAPQADLLLPLGDYDFFVLTPQLSTVAHQLADRVRSLTGIRDQGIPRFHTTDSQDLRVLMTEQSIRRLQDLYRQDYELLTNLSLPTTSHLIDELPPTDPSAAELCLSRILPVAQANRIQNLRQIIGEANLAGD